MRTRITRYAFWLLLLCLCNCAREKDFPHNAPYPVIRTVHATADSTGIAVSAEIQMTGTMKVVEYGFAFFPVNNPKQEVKVAVPVSGNKIETRLEDWLVKNTTYNIKAYAVTGGKTVYNQPVFVVSPLSSKPVIADFSPKEGASDTEVTITGSSFTTDLYKLGVFVGKSVATVVSADYNKIVIRIPDTDLFGSHPIRVILNGEEGISGQLLKIWGPEIVRMTKYEGMPGDTVTLFGNHLAGRWGPSVQVNNLAFKVLESSDTKVKLEIPLATTGTFDTPSPILLRTGAKSVLSSFTFVIKSNFAALAPLDLNARSRYMPSFEADGKGYFFDDNRVITYSTATGRWQEESSFPGVARTNPVWERIGDKAYLIGGISGNRYYGDVWEYDIKGGTWLQHTSLHFSLYAAASFVLDGKLYFAGGTNSLNRFTLWQYNTTTKQVLALKPLPVDVYAGMSFVKKGKAYYVSRQGMFVYEPASDSWKTESEQSPGFGFVFSNEDLGTYLVKREYIPELFHYQEESKTWLKVAYYPGCFIDSYDILFSGFATEKALYMGTFRANVNAVSCHNRFYRHQP